MRLLNKKIKAFTLSEMLVVLVISSIVVSLSFVVLNLVQKQINSIKNNYAKNTELQLLERALVYDFQSYNLFYNTKNRQLTGISLKDSVVYSFKENYVLRNADTIKVQTLEPIFYLDGNNVKENSIDAIEIRLSKEFLEKKLFISKTKDASFYINNNGV